MASTGPEYKRCLLKLSTKWTEFSCDIGVVGMLMTLATTESNQVIAYWGGAHWHELPPQLSGLYPPPGWGPGMELSVSRSPAAPLSCFTTSHHYPSQPGFTCLRSLVQGQRFRHGAGVGTGSECGDLSVFLADRKKIYLV